MMKRLVGQFNIIGKAALSSLAPALYRLGFVLLGVIIGLLWAYQGAPVKFLDAEPVHLAEGYKDQWIKMAAVEYAQSGDAEEVRRKIVEAGVSPKMIESLIAENDTTDPALSNDLRALLPIAEQSRSAATKQADKVKSSFLGGLMGPLACIVGTALIGIVLALFFTFYWAAVVAILRPGRQAAPVPQRSPAGATSPVSPVTAAVHADRVAAHRAASDQKTDFAAVGEEPPVAQYMSSYVGGDDLYDDSFSIETADGDFLGECGSGISETIGVGSPKKVTATEVWLFDKNDIRTVTKVMMSEHAFNDQALRARLAPKGEAVLASVGAITFLETQTLRVQIRVVDAQYAEGPLPPNSFFHKLTVEIAAWSKDDAGSSDRTSQPPDASAAFGDTAELLNY
jgi:hypothetical protein